MDRVPIFPGEPRPLLFAHRGASARAPENTMAAFRLARDLGAPGIELDIHILATGELVVVHDGDALRTCGADLRFGGARLEEVRRLDAGSWKGALWAGERIPLLAEVFEEFGERLYYDIEIKDGGVRDKGVEKALAALVRDFRLEGRVGVSSFNPVALLRFKARDGHIPTAIIWDDSPGTPWFLRRGEGRWLSACDYLKPDARLLSTPVRPAGFPVVAWTVDRPEEARHLLGLGCEGLISNELPALGLGLGLSEPMKGR